jgi:serine/threonine protein kinase
MCCDAISLGRPWIADECTWPLARLHQHNITNPNPNHTNPHTNTFWILLYTQYSAIRILYNRTHTACGTPGYVAPEILRGDPYGAEVRDTGSVSRTIT